MQGFLSPSRPVLATGSAKRFTLAQANRTLPLVSRVVADIVRTHDRAMAVQAAVEAAKHTASDAGPLHAQLDRCMDQLQDYVAELADVGCELKDYRTGLVAFVGRHQGRDVCLCWRLGDDRVGHWHELTVGYAGRKPVSILDER